jgi:hypothetical protein
MPLAAYFRNVGAVLLALLFVADFYLPTSPVVQRAAAYPPVIRIHTDRKWPERVVFDTTTAIVSAKPFALDTNVAASPGAGDAPTIRADASRVRDAFAMLPQPDARHVQSVDQNKRQVKQKTAARSTRKHARQIILAARQGQFAWFGFGFRTW